MHIENVQGCHESLHGERWHAINDPFFQKQIPVMLYKAGTEIKITLRYNLVCCTYGILHLFK